jgi:hypothetical protein
MRPLFPFVLLTASACGSDLLGPDFVEELVHFGGCGDVIFYAVDADDEVMVTFVAAGLVAEAREAGAETTFVIELPSEDVELIVEQGSRLSDATCDDVVVGSGPHVERTWTAVEGTATVRIRPLGGPGADRGDLVLEDIVVTGGDGSVLRVERLEWRDVSVGWYAG